MLANNNIHNKRSLSTLQLAALDFALMQSSQSISKIFVKQFDGQKPPVVFLITKDLPQLTAMTFSKNYCLATLGDKIQVKAFEINDAQNIEFLASYGVSRFY